MEKKIISSWVTLQTNYTFILLKLTKPFIPSLATPVCDLQRHSSPAEGDSASALDSASPMGTPHATLGRVSEALLCLSSVPRLNKELIYLPERDHRMYLSWDWHYAVFFPRGLRLFLVRLVWQSQWRLSAVTHADPQSPICCSLLWEEILQPQSEKVWQGRGRTAMVSGRWNAFASFKLQTQWYLYSFCGSGLFLIWKKNASSYSLMKNTAAWAVFSSLPVLFSPAMYHSAGFISRMRRIYPDNRYPCDFQSLAYLDRTLNSTTKTVQAK